MTLEQFLSWVETVPAIGNQPQRSQAIQHRLLPPDDLLQSLPTVFVDRQQARCLTLGQRLAMPQPDTMKMDEQYRIYQSGATGDAVEHFLGIGEWVDGQCLKMKKVFNAAILSS